MRKHINSKTREYVDILTDDLVLDDKVTLGSFNTVTSDAVAKAVAEAGGASYSAGSGIDIEGNVLSVKADGSTVTFNASNELTAVIPEQVNADWDSESGASRILNKPNLGLKEDVANKKQSIDGSSTTEYPSSKAVADYVGNAVSSASADYISDNGEPFASANDLPTDPAVVGNNDYAIVLDNGIYYRYKATVSGNTVTWALEYQINTSPLTPAQQNAVDSGIDSTKVSAYDTHVADTTIHVTTADKTAWNGKQDAIADLSDIRSGAALGATAVQDQSYVHTDNNFTNALKLKLEGVEAGAEVNVQADWAEQDSGVDSFVKNKPQNLVQDASYVHTDNNFTTSLKTKLEGIESGAQVNVKPNWNAAAGSDSEILNKPDLSVYATTSALTSGLAGKQDTLTAGSNVQINNNVISATDTTYTAGNGISISSGSVSVNAGYGLNNNMNGEGILGISAADGSLAVSNAGVRVTVPVPAPTSSDEDKVLGVTDAQGSYGWVPAPSGVDVHTVVVDDVNPYGLAPKTMRVQFGNANYDPSIHVWGDWVCTQVSSSPNVWDITFLKTLRLDDRIPYELSGGYAVLDINLYGVTSVREMLYQVSSLTALTITNIGTVSDMYNFCNGCYNLTSVTLPPLHSVTSLNAAFSNCNGLMSVSLQGLDNVVDMNYLFYGSAGLTSFPNWSQENLGSLKYVDAIFANTQNVQSGILDMYNKLSGIATIESHSDAFAGCGINGPAASELYNIPSSWGGYGA